MRVSGLGDLGSLWPSQTPEVAACGPSPCTWLDNVYARDACVAYMQCAAPNDPTTIGFTQGAAAGVGAEVGQGVGTAASSLGSSLTGSLNLPGVLLIAGVLVVGIFLLKR